MPQMSPLLWLCMFLNMVLILIFMMIIVYFVIIIDSLDPTTKVHKMKLDKFINSW
uniref:ATP synthase F0 subunit 8 n=1 Tax=Philotrypesis sp. JHX-2011 TaxID=1035792 RepID=G8EEI6_9HYME|nr:ATP synthase F0 subunit 8 [Philotrypesis sp. JHX-2011]